jgi:hypothetical protein
VDNSVKIAKEYANDFMLHTPVPIVEEIWAELFDTLSHDWILRVDPDEIFPSGLIPLITKQIADDDKIGAFTIPYVCYFLEKLLHGSVWGGLRRFTRLFHRDRINVFARVHAGYSLKNGYRLGEIPFDGNNAVQHYWVDHYAQLFGKHKRYLDKEGQGRYEQGVRFSWFQMAYETTKALYVSLIQQNGWRSYWSGWFLSFFYAVYELRSWLSLRKHEKSLQRN